MGKSNLLYQTRIQDLINKWIALPGSTDVSGLAPEDQDFIIHLAYENELDNIIMDREFMQRSNNVWAWMNKRTK